MPVYKNPPIQEAVCEFTFAPLKGNPEWDLTQPGRLQGRSELKEYSGKSRQQHMQTISAGGIKGQPEFALQQQLFRIHLPRPDNKALLSLGHNILGIVVLPPYEGWDNFKPRIVRALRVYMAETGLSTVARIGVRYINRIVTPNPDASSASDYITDMPSRIEASLLDERTKVETNVKGTLTALNSRHEFVTPEGIKIFVTQATLDPEKAKTAEYLLDIDTVCDQQPIDGVEKITSLIEQLHAIEGTVFESYLTNEARKLFNA